MKLPLDWLREFAPVDASAVSVASRLAACGFETASVDGDVIDVEITANRPDCLSVYGLAREAAAAFDVALGAPPDGPRRDGTASIPASIGDAGCGRYAIAVAKVSVGPSPDWLASRLHAAGVRPINNVVDVTNYVMLETGHPLHAFDVARLAGPEIRVRRARPGEKLVTLDHLDRALDDSMLVIADREKAVAVAGVMGGAASEVTDQTSHVAIESAWFLPAAVRATARKLGLKTEASARFERGADLTAPMRALRRTLALLEEIGAGSPVAGVSDVYPRPHQPRLVALSRQRLTRLLGDTVPDRDVERILSKLGFELAPASDGWLATVPAYRVDVAREADLIEEVGRHWGFDRIPATYPASRLPAQPMVPAVSRDRMIRRVLCGAGLQEACTFTFIEREAAAPFVSLDADLVTIANPLSEKFAVLRPSLVPGLLDALIYNRRRETPDVRLFESGSAFTTAGEHARVAWVMAGPRQDHWSGSAGDVDTFDALGIAELLGEAFGVRVSARPTGAYPWLVRGRAAEIVGVGEDAAPVVVGFAGELLPDLAARRGLGQRTAVVAGEIDTRALEAAAPARHRRVDPLPRYPSIVRDIAILVNERLPAADLRGTIRSSAPPTLVSILEFDRYTGAGVPEGTISLALRLTFRDRDRTLTDADVQQAMDSIVVALREQHGATLRQ